MQKYQKHGIENHPAISAEYVRFLVTNSAHGANTKVNLQMSDWEKKLNEALTIAMAANSIAGIAQNAAAEAKKKGVALKKDKP